MKSILVILFIAVGTLAHFASGQAEAKSSSSAAVAVSTTESSGPRIQFAETTFDFGKIDSSELMRHDFIFTNTGAATLEIKDVKPGCGCTTAGAWDKQVEPGKTGIIPLQFNPSSFSGPISKSALVTCNDPATSKVTLLLKGTVWKAIDVTPLMAVFNISDESETIQTRIIRIVSHLEEPIELSDLQCSNRAFQAEIKTVKPGKEFQLQITAVPPFSPTPITAPIALKTSSPKTPTIHVSAHLALHPAVTVSPEQITLPVGPLTNATRFVISVRTSGTNVLSLSDAQLNVPGADVQILELMTGKFFQLTGHFPVGFQTPRGQSVELTAKSNHPKFPLIHVPVFQMQPASYPKVFSNSPSAARIVSPKPVLPVATGQ